MVEWLRSGVCVEQRVCGGRVGDSRGFMECGTDIADSLLSAVRI